MEKLLENLITQSVTWSLIIILLISFFESLALVGLILPGAILMASLGAMIGSNKIDLYPAWFAGTVGCLLGDWLSYYIGCYFKTPLIKWKFLKKYTSILNKIKNALYEYSTLTILIGRFLGHTRPLIPLIAGMIGLSAKKIIIPNIIGCLLWPLFYFMPGILAGIIIDIPNYKNSGIIKILLFFAIIIFWLGMWFFWKWKNFDQQNKNNWFNKMLSVKQIKWIAFCFLFTGIITFIGIQFHPMMILFRKLLYKIFI